MNLTFTNLSQIGFSQMGKLDFLFERLALAAGNLVVLCGTGYSGKSLFAQYLALNATSSKELFGNVLDGGAVLHIDQEQAQFLTHLRYVRMANALSLSKWDVLRATLPYRFDDPARGRDAQSAFYEACCGKRLVIIDSLKATTLADENSPAISNTLHFLRETAERTGACILILHHMGKTVSDLGRGHSSIYDSADVFLTLTPSKRHGKAYAYTIDCTKNRLGQIIEPLTYSISDEGEWQKPQACSSSLVFSAHETEGEERLADTDLVLNQLTGTTLGLRETIEATGLSQKRAYAAINSLVTTGLISESAGPNRARLFTAVSSECEQCEQ